jgi:hypothetical protein
LRQLIRIIRQLKTRATLALLGVAALAVAPTATAQGFSVETGGKLLLTRGITNVDGAAGGGLTPWAVIAGNETDRGIGGTAHYTHLETDDYRFEAFGGAIGLYDRVELSYTRQEFDTRDAGAALGIGQGFTFGQDIYGAKVRLAGDAVYDQDRWLPQISVGALYKEADHAPLLGALGAEDDQGVEVYASATKLLLAQSLLLNGTLRYTDANQNGLLGFGGTNDKQIQPEVSLAYMLSPKLVIGGEYRFKPDNLAFAQEDDWIDLFAAYAFNEHATFTAAYADLGSIATFDEQRGLYLSLQLGF